MCCSRSEPNEETCCGNAGRCIGMYFPFVCCLVRFIAAAQLQQETVTKGNDSSPRYLVTRSGYGNPMEADVAEQELASPQYRSAGIAKNKVVPL